MHPGWAWVLLIDVNTAYASADARMRGAGSLQGHSYDIEGRRLRRKDPGTMWRHRWRRSVRLAVVVTAFVLSGVGIARAQQAPGSQTPQSGQTKMPNMPGMRMPNDLGIVSGVVTKSSGGPVSGAAVG